MNTTDLLGRMSVRERSMLGLLILVGLLIWGSYLWRIHDELSIARAAAELEWEQQEAWLGNAEQIERELAEERERIDEASTLDASGLVATVDALARARELTYELSTPVSTEEELFRWHTLRIGIRNARLPDLIRLDRSIRERYPYVALEELSITANRADPRIVGARLTVSSYQSSLAESTPPPEMEPAGMETETILDEDADDLDEPIPGLEWDDEEEPEAIPNDLVQPEDTT